MIFESHAHYDDEAFDEDREALLSSLAAQGIGTVVNIGASLAGSRASVKLAEQYPFIYAAVGVHPGEVEELNEETFAELRALCAHEKTVAVGEIGLDYHYPEPEADLQKKWFERQLMLARKIGLPVVIHSREAAKDTLDILQTLRAGGIGGVVHCFSYTKETAREYLNMDFYFGIGGVITFPNAKKLKEAVAYIPMEKILLETDSPYLAPQQHRGERNSSLNLSYVAEEIAAIKGISRAEVERITEENARRLFGL
ncbi:MAG: TatD family hydrolase [Bacteroidales bacterium]|nr:TatD family hydrolase [Bacteroidales bacterium]MCM1415549.1 TatD family hydrolase [bacterium]MCM1424382.1 TatD family hydrolase [bacterium]